MIADTIVDIPYSFQVDLNIDYGAWQVKNN